MIMSSSQDFLTYSSTKTSPPLKFPLSLLKIPAHRKIAYSLIPPLRTSFIPLTCGIQVLYITTNLRKSSRKLYRKIHLFIPLGLINSSNSCSTTLCRTKKYITYGQKDSYPLTQKPVNAYKDSAKSSTILSKVI